MLRPDLRLLVMSATLDSHKVAALLEDAPVIACEGRQFPVEERYLPLPPAAAHSGPQALWPHMADVIAALMRQESGSLLAFLPGTARSAVWPSCWKDACPPIPASTLFTGC